MAFDFKPFSAKALNSIYDSNARINIWEGAVRSSKTINSIIRWIIFTQEAPPNGKLVMSGVTATTLKRNVLDVIIDIVGTKNARYNKATQEFKLYDKTIEIIGANDARAESKIRGMTMSGFYGDEVTLLPEPFFRMILSRLSVKNAKAFLTTNPDNPFHWFKKDFLDRSGLNLKRFTFLLEDNLSLDPAYVASLKKEYTGIWYKRFIEGLWVLAEGVVYDMFDEGIHCDNVLAIEQAQPHGKFANYIVSIDYGTTNPCTFGLYGFNGYSDNDKIYLVKEYYYDSKETGKTKTDAEYRKDLEEFIKDGNRKILGVYIDPSAASFIAECRDAGIHTTSAINDVLNGIRFVGSLLHRRRYVIDYRAKKTIAEYSAYLWDEKAALVGDDVPKKKNDHACDRDRYALYSHFTRNKIVVGGER